jgi:uncharacterized membrane protein
LRHLAGGSHAEDLGFTDQVLGNFLRGQFFRMSIYSGATWNTELDISRIARPDSLLAFHFEPMLLLLLPLYALGGGIVALLVLQAVAVAAGAIPAYRLGRYATNSDFGGLAVAAAYLLSPLGQWAVLSDFHTSTLAAPLLVLSLERLVVGRAPLQALLAAALAATAREDVGPALVVLGLVLVLRKRNLIPGLALLGVGVGFTILAALVIRTYSGGTSPFETRYGATLGAGLLSSLAALGRPQVASYAQTLILSGGWLGVLNPLALLPALPTLLLNVFSTSPWMAAGKAHYSGLVLPFITAGAAAGLHVLRRRPPLVPVACTALVVTAVVACIQQGGGPLGGNYAPAYPTSHAARAGAIADSLPPAAVISASSPLVPHLTTRPHVYVFPAILDAEYVFVDTHASPAPTSAGDVFLRIQALLAQGSWQVVASDDGLLLLQRSGEAPSGLAPAALLASDVTATDTITSGQAVAPSLVSAALVPPRDGAIDVDGPRWILRTRWRTEQALPPGTRLEFTVDLSDGEQLHLWDVADLWWNPPQRWLPNQTVTVNVPNIPVRLFKSWQASWSIQ